jgi:hypothetical protein
MILIIKNKFIENINEKLTFIKYHLIAQLFILGLMFYRFDYLGAILYRCFYLLLFIQLLLKFDCS